MKYCGTRCYVNLSDLSELGVYKHVVDCRGAECFCLAESREVQSVGQLRSIRKI